MSLPICAAAGVRITGMNLSGSLLMSLVGIGVVFVALAAIMALIKLQSAVLSRFTSHRAAPMDPVVPILSAGMPGTPAMGVPAPGSVGELALYGVPDKTAAMLMAIVADEMRVPLNELRFISIREAE